MIGPSPLSQLFPKCVPEMITDDKRIQPFAKLEKAGINQTDFFNALSQTLYRSTLHYKSLITCAALKRKNVFDPEPCFHRAAHE